VSTSSPVVLASGRLTRSGDTLTVELHRPANSPSFVMVVWPQNPRSPNPHPLAALAAAMVRCLAEAQTELAAKIRNSQ
jgi:hypothetical protein